MLDPDLKFYAVPSRPTSVTLKSMSQTSKIKVKSFWLKFLEVYFSWILLILCPILGTGVKFNAAPASPSLTLRSRSQISKFYAEVFD